MIAWHLLAKSGLCVVRHVLFLEGNPLKSSAFRGRHLQLLSLHVYDSHYRQLTEHLPIPLLEIQMRVLLSAAQRCYSDASGLVSLIGGVLLEPSLGSDRGSPLSVLCVALPPPTQLLIGWINLEGNLTRSRIPPKLTIGIVFYICPQERQMFAFEHIHIWIPLFGYNGREYKREIFWRSRQMHHFGGQDALR